MFKKDASNSVLGHSDASNSVLGHSEANLGPRQTSMVDLFCEKS